VRNLLVGVLCEHQSKSDYVLLFQNVEEKLVKSSILQRSDDCETWSRGILIETPHRIRITDAPALMILKLPRKWECCLFILYLPSKFPHASIKPRCMVICKAAYTFVVLFQSVYLRVKSTFSLFTCSFSHFVSAY
jgi:hypothetical protein